MDRNTRFKPDDKVFFVLSILKYSKYVHIYSQELTQLLGTEYYSIILQLLTEFSLIEIDHSYMSKEVSEKHGLDYSYPKGYRKTHHSKKMAEIYEVVDLPIDIYTKVLQRFAKQKNKQSDSKEYELSSLGKINKSLSKLIINDIDDELVEKYQEIENEEAEKENRKRLNFSEILNSLKESRTVYQKNNLDRRIYSKIALLPSEIRNEAIKSELGDDLHEVDISGAQAQFSVIEYYQSNSFNTDDIELVGKAIDEVLYEYFMEITEQVTGNDYTRDQIKLATISLFNSSEKYVDSLLFSQDLEPKQQVIKDLYSTLIQKHNSYITFTKTLNTTQALINAFSVKAVRFDKQSAKNKRKDNSAYYLQYSAFESRVMKRIIDQIDEEIGEISLYTVYDAVYVERHHVEQVEQIMKASLLEEYCK